MIQFLRKANFLKRFILFWTPNGILSYIRRRNGWQHIKTSLLNSGYFQEFKKVSNHTKFEYLDAVNFLVSNGIPEIHVKQGSISKSSLDFIDTFLKSNFRNDKPLVGLHVGNFIGLSLASITYTAKSIHQESVVFSIDPNIPHRSVKNPIQWVNSLLDRYDLLANSVILVGYSGSPNNFMETPFGEDKNSFDLGASPRNALKNLSLISQEKFDFLLLDGNHEESSLMEELTLAKKILKKGGYIFLDDVTEIWAEVHSVYNSIETYGYKKVSYDGRVAIIQFIS